MKNKDIIKSVPFLAIVIILLVKLLFPEFSKDQPNYLYFVSFLALISLISAVLHFLRSKIDLRKSLFLLFALTLIFVIVYFQYKKM